LHGTLVIETAVKYADIIKPQKPAFKNVVAFNILPVYPPGKIDQQFLENLFRNRISLFPVCFCSI